MLKQPLSPGEIERSIPEVLVENDLRGGNPFPGLRPFSLDECHLFFGREGQADEILVKLAEHRFVTVMGYSGSGKSSLMYCGLLPVLFGGFMTQTGPHWNAIVSRPGSSPLGNLTDSIVDQLIQNNQVLEADREIHKAIINSVLRSGPEGLVEVSRFIQTHKGENVFFLIDQFEELLRYRELSEDVDAHNEAQLYVNLVMTAVAQDRVPVYVSLTMRSDFIGNCSVFPHLTELINRSNYLVPQMTREQKKMVIEGPVAVGGGRISQRLVKQLLKDVGNNQDQLPILQHSLMRTWEYWTDNREPGEPIDVRHYNAIGRIHEALSQHANEAYDELNSKQKEIAETLFKNITEKSPDNKGMRRPVRLGLVAELAEVEEGDVIEVIDHFRKPGRSFLMPGANIALDNNSMIELSHESLMRIWKRLGTWVEEEFESAQMYKRLSEAAAMYQIGKTGLWRPPDLQLALNWQKKQRPTREWAQRYDETFERAIVFLDTSRITYEAELKNQEMMQRRVLRRTRATAVILGIAFVAAIALFVLAYIQKLRADSQRLEADNQRQEAIRQTKLAEANQKLAEQQKDLAIREGLAKERALEQAEKNFRDLQIALREADAAKRQAEDNMVLANIQRDTADVQRAKAQNEYRRAEANLQLASRLYMLAIAQTLATKSVQEDDDPNLAGLLAMQGYRFHERNDNGEHKYDPYIYNGLYSALTKLNSLTYNAARLPGPSHVHVKSLALSSKTNTFYTSGADGRIMVGDHQKLTVAPSDFSTPYPSKVIALSKDENYLVNGSDSTFIQIYDLRENGGNKAAQVVRGFNGGTNDIEFLPDNSGFIVASTDKTISRVDVRGNRTSLGKLQYEVKSFNISKDGKTMAAATWTGQVLLVSLPDLSTQVLVDDKTSRILSVKYSRDGKVIAFGTDDMANRRGLVKTYNLATKELRQFTGHRAGVNDVEFSPDGKLLASAGADKQLLLWIVDDPQALPVSMENNSGFVWDISFTPGSDYLVAACSESEVRVWPTDPALLAQQICPLLKRNMTVDEWQKYVKKDIEYEPTCVGLLINDY